jgi:hypothetical protein
MLDAFIIDQIRRREDERERRQRPNAERPGAEERPDTPGPTPADGWSAPRRSAAEDEGERRGVWSVDDDDEGAGFVIDM